jgi:hypothetical protein
MVIEKSRQTRRGIYFLSQSRALDVTTADFRLKPPTLSLTANHQGMTVFILGAADVTDGI